MIVALRRPVTRAILLAIALWTPLSAGAPSPDCLALLTAQVVRQMGSQSSTAFRIAADGGQASVGLAAVLRARPDDAGLRIRQISEFFGDTVAADVFEQLALVKHAEGFDLLVVNLAKQSTDAQGAAAVLRYSTTMMSPTAIARFEFPVPGGVVDILDDAGNLLEFKSLNLADYPEFLVRQELERVRSQGEIFQQYAQSSATRFTLVFENPIPIQWQSVFGEILGDLVSRSNVTFIDGF